MHHIKLRSALVTGLIFTSGIGVLGVASATSNTTHPAPAGAVDDKRVEPVDRGSKPALVEQFPTSLAAGYFTAINLYRAYDSRVNSNAKIHRGDRLNIDMLTNYQNIPMIPSYATAIAFNITVTNTESTFGFVTIFPGDIAAIPDTSSINWVLPNFTIANGGIVALGTLNPWIGTIDLAMNGASDAAAHVIVDVTGYYEP